MVDQCKPLALCKCEVRRLEIIGNFSYRKTTYLSPYLVKAHTIGGASNIDDPGVYAVDLAGLQPVLCVQLAHSQRSRQGGWDHNGDQIERLNRHVARCY